ncbi:MAG: L-histidine N(alpha)-methyltransferase [Spiribacter sp.]|nr:L-histidine N(alpha)-methyltransferase [Spiribacter sp.]
MTETLKDDVLAALRDPGHRIPSTWLYDQRGSELFEAITRLPSYYPTRTEISILDAHLADIAAVVPTDSLVVELGSGSSRKTAPLLRALEQPAGYVPLDISAAYLAEAAETLRTQVPNLPIHPWVADFTTAFDLPPDLPAHTGRLGFFPGSTIGNLTAENAHALLRHCHTLLGDGARFLLGIDLDKSPEVLIPAYDDPEGVTAEFNRNLLVRINRELDANFDLAAFRHEARYFEDPPRIEMHLVCERPVSVQMAGESFELEAGESLHTETSHKYSIAGFTALAAEADWVVSHQWHDAESRFAVLMMQSTPD